MSLVSEECQKLQKAKLGNEIVKIFDLTIFKNALEKWHFALLK
jgi:hypothetical protein